MKAVVCKEFGPPERLVVEEVESPMPGMGQVVLDVEACGVNFPDTLIIQGLYQFKPDFPFTPGSEVAGVVKAVGDDAKRVKVGDRVIGFTGVGGFAEEVAVDAAHLIPMPSGMDFTTAAAVVLPYGTSLHALTDRAQLEAGETLLVLGAAGGVGLAAVQLGKLMGAHVIAAASTDEKLAVCKQHGADELINYANENLKERVKELTGGEGVDVVYDPVGGPYTEVALRAMAWRGRLLVVGFAAGDIPRIPINLTLLKGCSIVGVFWGEFAARAPERNAEHLHQLLRWLSTGALKPHIGGTYPLARAADALTALMQRKVTGKLVLLP
jgi:NADPH2:quinone reductase